MTTFLFWNLHKRFPEAALRALIDEWQVDIAVFAEMPEGLAAPQLGPLSLSPGRTTTAITIYSHLTLGVVEESHRTTIRSWHTSAGDILIAATHLPSALHFSENDRMTEAGHLARRLYDLEEQRHHQRTIVVGDLNMNPFEPGLVSTGGLHAVPSRHIAEEGERIIQGRSYRFFYNPMWAHLGDDNSTVAGTYFYRKSVPTCYFWNVFDQVLLRPNLLPFWRPESLRILTGTRDITFVDAEGQPNQSLFSDHLPILFRFDLSE